MSGETLPGGAAADHHMQEQFTLALPAPPVASDDLLVPARMVNEWVYCPRLAYLEWVEGQWAESADTADGTRRHRRVDQGKGKLPPAADLDPASADTGANADNGKDTTGTPDRMQTRSVELGSHSLGLVAKIDLLEIEDGMVAPVDYKRGKRPHREKGAHEPERVQLCAQALILEDHGYKVGTGYLWFVESRERVPVAFDDELRALTRRAAHELRLAAAARRIPPPLPHSRKCPRCSLLPICLPDEVELFRHGAVPRTPPPPISSALPLYVQQPGARIGKSGEELTVTTDDGEQRVALADVSELILAGPVNLSTPALHALIRKEVPVAWMSSGFWFLGTTGARGPRSAAIRRAQYTLADNPRRALGFARSLVAAKIRNQRTLLRRNWRGESADRDVVLDRLKRLMEKAPTAAEPAILLGIEGEAAALYFRAFPELFNDTARALPEFGFERRSRRPPADPVNAALSLCYALLLRVLGNALEIAGLDPWLGFYHVERPGRPALALDLMEPFRPILADSAVLTAINNGEIGPGDFITIGSGCNFTAAGRRHMIEAFERRLEQETTHPVFGYQLSMRRMLQIQARLLAHYCRGELDDYPHYTPR